ncbi:MAG: sulfotransferase domain-containing protein [Desulfovermiculus sp.]|nr:sulfotransferase domain-containing protein [Desulfovermiculus sp.]
MPPLNPRFVFFGDKQIKAIKSWVQTDFCKHPQAPGSLREFISFHCHKDLTTEDAAGLYWLLYNDAYRFLNLQDEGRRVLLVCYDNLVQNPAKTTQEIATFLDLEWTRSMAEDVYSGSVGKNKKPDLSPSIDRECQKVWEFIKGSHDHIFPLE